MSPSRGSTVDPSQWGEYLAEDAQDGDAAEWWTWAGTTITNTWDSERQSLVIDTDDPDASGTRACVGDVTGVNNPNDVPWNQARTVLTHAAQRQESGNMRFDIWLTDDVGDKTISHLGWGSGSGTWNSTQGWISIGAAWGDGAPGDWVVHSRDVVATTASI